MPSGESDLVVACDGVRSRLREQLVGDPLRFLGLVSIGGLVVDGSSVSHELVTGGGFLTVGQNASLYVQTFARDGRVLWSFTQRTSDESWGRDVPLENLRSRVLERVKDWHPPAAALIEETRDQAPGAGILAFYDREPPRTSTPPMHRSGSGAGRRAPGAERTIDNRDALPEEL